MDPDSWRSQLSMNGRRRIIAAVEDAIMKRLPAANPHFVRDLSERFEQKMFDVATSQPDYIRKIAFKLVTFGRIPLPVGIPPAAPTTPPLSPRRTLLNDDEDSEEE